MIITQINLIQTPCDSFVICIDICDWIWKWAICVQQQSWGARLASGLWVYCATKSRLPPSAVAAKREKHIVETWHLWAEESHMMQKVMRGSRDKPCIWTSYGIQTSWGLGGTQRGWAGSEESHDWESVELQKGYDHTRKYINMWMNEWLTDWMKKCMNEMNGWNEMKWNEMKWNEMKWNEMKWNEMKWNEWMK